MIEATAKAISLHKKENGRSLKHKASDPKSKFGKHNQRERLKETFYLQFVYQSDETSEEPPDNEF